MTAPAPKLAPSAPDRPKPKPPALDPLFADILRPFAPRERADAPIR